ncbi:MAG TPA: hypothetical protein PLP17_16370 [Oligoflexia bacterium]|nr:hypothetical protein [Oligoflexia bacterium]
MKLSELSAEPGKYEKLIDEIEHGNHFILRVGPGEALPLRAAMTLPFVRLEAGNNKLVFSREVYIYLAKGVLRLSPDAQQWADIQDTDAMKEIFGVDTFNLLLGFGANQADGAFFSFSLGSE